MGGSLPELENGFLSAGMVSGREERLVQLVAGDWLSQRGWRLGMGLGGALGANSEI